MKFTERKVSDLVGAGAKYKDHIGVEIELEHAEMPRQLEPPLRGIWREEGDGSLRMNGVEYVLKTPKSPELAKKAVSSLGGFIDSYTKVIDEGRAGVHIHVNVSDLTVREMVNLVALWHCVEPTVVNWCGEHRKGNLFCLRLKDAEYIVDRLTLALEGEDLRHLNTDEIRYAAVNLKSVVQYGSLEFRCMRSDGSWEDINLLIDLLMRLKGLARQVDNPVQVVADSSASGYRVFLEEVLGEFSGMFERTPDFEQEVYEAIRRIQQYAYCKEW